MTTKPDPQFERRTERRTELQLTDAHIDQIAERAAVKAMEKLTAAAYMSIGKGVVSRVFLLAGVLSTALFCWAWSKGLFK